MSASKSMMPVMPFGVLASMTTGVALAQQGPGFEMERVVVEWIYLELEAKAP